MLPLAEMDVTKESESSILCNQLVGNNDMWQSLFGSRKTVNWNNLWSGNQTVAILIGIICVYADFAAVLLEVTASIEQCSFIAFDAEFTGE